MAAMTIRGRHTYMTSYAVRVLCDTENGTQNAGVEWVRRVGEAGGCAEGGVGPPLELKSPRTPPALGCYHHNNERQVSVENDAFFTILSLALNDPFQWFMLLHYTHPPLQSKGGGGTREPGVDGRSVPFWLRISSPDTLSPLITDAIALLLSLLFWLCSL